MRRFIGPVVALALVAASPGCASQEPYRAEYEGAVVDVDMTPPPGVEPAALEVVWGDDLWANMAADVETQALIRRLFSDLPVVLGGPSGDAPANGAGPGDTIRVHVSDVGLPMVQASFPSGTFFKARRDVRVRVDGPPGLTLHLEPPSSGDAPDLFAPDLEVVRIATAEFVARKLGAPWAVQGPSIEARVEQFRRACRWSLASD